MVNFKDEIAKLIAEKVEGLELSEIQDMIEVPQDTKMGDYALSLIHISGLQRKRLD